MNLKRIFTAALVTGLLTAGAASLHAATGAELFTAAWDGAADTIDDATFNATTQDPTVVNEIITAAFDPAAPAQYPGIVVAAIRALKTSDTYDCDRINNLVKHSIDLTAVEAKAQSPEEDWSDLIAAILDAAIKEADQCAGVLTDLGSTYLDTDGVDDGGLSDSNVIPPGALGTPPAGGTSGFDNPDVIEEILDSGDDDEEDDEDPSGPPVIIVVPGEPS